MAPLKAAVPHNPNLTEPQENKKERTEIGHWFDEEYKMEMKKKG
jgi:hypothetical protein